MAHMGDMLDNLENIENKVGKSEGKDVEKKVAKKVRPPLVYGDPSRRRTDSCYDQDAPPIAVQPPGPAPAGQKLAEAAFEALRQLPIMQGPTPNKGREIRSYYYPSPQTTFNHLTYLLNHLSS